MTSTEHRIQLRRKDDEETAMDAWIQKLNETFIETGYYTLLLDGFKNTIIITAGALVIGLAIGVLIAVINEFSKEIPFLKPFAFLCKVYVTAIRGIPIVVLLLVFYYIILKSTDGVIVGILAFGFNSGAYMAELIRGGINGVDKGQEEAARSLGLSNLQTMRLIILPQATRYILPAIGNEFIALLKETSVAGYVAVVDLTRAGNLIRNNTYDATNPLLIVAAVYLIMVILLTQLLRVAERKLSEGYGN